MAKSKKAAKISKMAAKAKRVIEKTLVGSTEAGKVASGEKKARKKSKKESFSTYIFKVLRQVHPDAGISSKAMITMNSFVFDIFERIVSECTKLVKYSNSKTLTSRDVQSAVRFLLPGELAKHAVSEGTKAVTKYTTSIAKKD
ncbi:hypothetical protein PVAND_005226 [Polypedilum vanderplanki]|uniref:Core Histone H2A/H2B/H3 domain-containing protein n=1 Tax=Polypedilum vanderplanki TaxID=319348 RepID=A0A9J6C0H6_POLVA|nr:hypothetical protein PVAND_005226 [Polypedilum vanderplanki]